MAVPRAMPSDNEYFSSGPDSATMIKGHASVGFVLTCTLCFVLAVTTACNRSGDKHSEVVGPRHVIFISVDTLRSDHLGCYGNDWIQSPSIDNLAAEAVLFENCSSTATTTLPSHTSMMTGLYPHGHGVPRNGFMVHDSNTMLAEFLSEKGFITAGFNAAIPLDPITGFDQGFLEFGSLPLTEQRQSADDINRKTLDWVAKWKRDQVDSDRLFLFIHYYDVHTPYEQPPPFSGMYRDTDVDYDLSLNETIKLLGIRDWMQEAQAAEEPADKLHAQELSTLEQSFGKSDLDEALGPEARAELQQQISIAKKAARQLAQDYAAGVTYCDDRIGQLLEALDAFGILEESVLVLTSDHGEMLTEHGTYFCHGKTVHQHELHVPLLIRLPGAENAGYRVAKAVSGVDLTPTILDLLGLDVPQYMEGRSLRACLEERELDPAPVFGEATNLAHKYLQSSERWPNRINYQSVQLRGYKYQERTRTGDAELFNLRVDPDEKVNLLESPTPKIDSVHQELQALLNQWRAQADFPPLSRVELEEMHEGLEALGYVDGK